MRQWGVTHPHSAFAMCAEDLPVDLHPSWDRRQSLREVVGKRNVEPIEAAIYGRDLGAHGRCGRARAVYRKFGLCRICLREMAHQGQIPGMTKSSW